MMRGVIYARYSEGPRQTDQSIDGQVADCRAYAEQHGIDIIRIYADRHVSGTSTEGRDEFRRMMHDADRRLFDCVIIWKIDRFGRSREDIAVNKIRLRKAGVQLHYAKESVPEGPEGILLESLLEGLAEYYSADLRQKVVRGKRESAKRGEYPMKCLPIGYIKGEDKKIHLVEHEAEAVREAFRMHIAGATTKELTEYIFQQTGRRLNKSSIGSMLRNEHYVTGYNVHGISVPAPQIIDRATFEEAARCFRGGHHNAAGRAKMEYLLSMTCHCEKCGRLLQGVSGRGKLGRVYYYYKCPTKGCMKPIPKDELERLVIEATTRDVLTDEMIEKLTARIMEIQEAERSEGPAEALRSELQDLEKRRRNLLTALEQGAGKSVVERLGELEAEIEQKSVELEKACLEKPVVPTDLVRGWLLSFKAGDVSDPVFRRRLVSTFLADVIVGPEYVTCVYNTKEKGPQRVRIRPSEQAHQALTRTPRIEQGFIILRIPRAVTE